MNDTPEQYFQLFGPPHLSTLGFILLICILIGLCRRHFTPLLRLSFRYGLASLMILESILIHWWFWQNGNWDIRFMLPLHLCSLLVIISIILLLNKNHLLYEYVYFLGLAGTTQALLTPDLHRFPFPHLVFFLFFIAHGGIVITAIYMTAVESYRPTWASFKRVFISINLYLVCLFLINWLIGSNYMYIMHKPYGESLLDYLGPWPWYILSGEVIAFISFFLLYIPFVVYDRHQTACQKKT